MQNTIYQYKNHPALSACQAAFVLVIKEEHSAQNDALFLENRTGYWSIGESVAIIGSAIFLVAGEVDGIRKLHAGVVEKIIPVKDKKVVQVQQFLTLPDITVGFQEFFGLKGTAPNSPTRLAEWSPGAEGRVADATQPPVDEAIDAALGQMVERLSWHRLNHHVFRNSVWKMWEGRCAVTGANCNGVLVASHIFPWTRSTEQERTEKHNGLLLSAGLDALFDRGLIGFTSDGDLLISAMVTTDTCEVFGLRPGLQLRADCFSSQVIPDRMAAFLARHQKLHRLG